MQDWPYWCIFVLGALCLTCVILQYTNPGIHIPYIRENNFRKFQIKYLCVFYVVMFADWLQGVTMHDLYTEYAAAEKANLLRLKLKYFLRKKNMSAPEPSWVDGTTHHLFVTGFAVSAFVSLFIGQYIDILGRKKSCVAYCILEVIINALEHIPTPTALFIGRILGGVSSSILFVAFESWMVTEHRRLGFHNRLLKYTISLAYIGNGIVAMIAGIVAQLLKDRYGNIGPFRCAILLSVALMVYIHMYWRENYGESNVNMRKAYRYIFSNKSLLILGIVQSFFECAVFTFVFNWVSALKTEWTGIVFSCFMICISIGSTLFQIFVVSLRVPSHRFGIPVLCLASLSMAIAAHSGSEFATTLTAFLIFEICIGATMANQSSLRSEHIPQETMASVMNVLRVPLNILASLGIYFSSQFEISSTLYGCAACLALSAMMHYFIQPSQLNKLP